VQNRITEKKIKSALYNFNLVSARSDNDKIAYRNFFFFASEFSSFLHSIQKSTSSSGFELMDANAKPKYG
jgi:hypothetical protein